VIDEAEVPDPGRLVVDSAGPVQGTGNDAGQFGSLGS